jgi:hypothetical protein
MKILVVIHSYAPALNPRSFRWSAIAEHWAARGHTVDVVCAAMGYDDHRTMLRVLVLDPLGLDRFRIGRLEPEAERPPFATLRAEGEWMTEAEVEQLTGLAGLDMGDLGGIAETALLGLNQPVAQDGGLPGGGGLGTGADLAMLYQAFLTNPDELWVPEVLADGIGSGDLAIGDLVDGMKLDERGNVWVTGPGGVWVFDPDGNHIGTVEVPENVGNVNWGGPNWDQLFIPATSSMYRIQCKVSGNRLPYMR